MKDSRAGFTLIELLVVIGILSLLVTAFAPDIIGMMSRGDKVADQRNLQWVHQQLLAYQQKYKRIPRHSGSKFVLAPWVEKVCERTPQNFQRFFTPGLLKEDGTAQVFLEDIKADPDSVCASYDDVTSEHTHYAGRNLKAEKAGARLMSGKEPLAANDNEYGPAFDDSTIHVLMGDGHVSEIFEQELVEQYGFDPKAGEPFLVGDGSPHPLLQKLMKD